MNNEIVNLAEDFAKAWHKDQKYGKHPYTKHLYDVYHMLLTFEEDDDEILAASFLHDILEDTEVTYDTLKDNFGEKVADIVKAVTNETGKNKFKRTYEKIKNNKAALRLKLADRIANIRACIVYRVVDKYKMYKRHYPQFKNSLKTEGEYEEMWSYLDYLMMGEIKDEKFNWSY